MKLGVARTTVADANGWLTADPAADYDDILIGICVGWGRGLDRLSTRTIPQVAGSFLR